MDKWMIWGGTPPIFGSTPQWRENVFTPTSYSPPSLRSDVTFIVEGKAARGPKKKNDEKFSEENMKTLVSPNGQVMVSNIFLFFYRKSLGKLDPI